MSKTTDIKIDMITYMLIKKCLKTDYISCLIGLGVLTSGIGI